MVEGLSWDTIFKMLVLLIGLGLIYAGGMLLSYKMKQLERHEMQQLADKERARCP
jgi:hypothetical protein